MLFNFIRRVGIAGAGLFLSAGVASAHHLMGGKIPSTISDGILSGVGHPVIGPDHLAFLLALGITVGVARLSFMNPLLFLVAMACGVGAHVARVNIPATELIVAISVLLAGVMLVVERRIPTGWWMTLFVVAGFFHGYAYGESIYGAEPAPLAAYLAGLVAIQTVLVVGVALITRALWRFWSVAPRLAGAAICGVGFTVLITQVVPAP